jgi:hypothetical protein
MSKYAPIKSGKVPHVDGEVTEEQLKENAAKIRDAFNPIIEGPKDAEVIVSVYEPGKCGASARHELTQRDLALFMFVLDTALERGAKWERASHAAANGVPAELAMMAGLLDMPMSIIDALAEVGKAVNAKAEKEEDEAAEVAEIKALFGLD